MAKATTRAETMYQDLSRQQSSIEHLESVVIQLRQEKAQFEEELIASQKRTEDEVRASAL